MSIQPVRQTAETPPTTDAILARLDAIMRELQALRQVLLVTQPLPSTNMVDRLWGALGQGAAEELQAYENDIYLELFNDEPAG